ncbi:MAG: serine hydrolase domain-containing protein [Ignavibacteriaceae bacterium]|jgi:CubicO group peptidase (beta-lactamase class C family)
MINKKRLFLIVACVLFISCNEDTPVAPSNEPLGFTSVGAPAQSLTEFESVLERIRTDLKIPGFSAAITKNRKIVWAKGFGHSNKERGINATPETVYHLASVTKPFAAVIVMQLIEENKLTLETPISDYGINLDSQGIIRVKHLLSHTSEGVPGSHYNYSGNRYAYLDAVISGASGKTFCELLNEKIILPLNLNLTAPNPLSPNNCLQNTSILDKLAQGYTPNGQNPMPLPSLFVSAAGLISNVIDVSKFSIALDNDELLTPQSKELMFTPLISNSGNELPHGLGVFVDNNEDVNIIWHYGYWDSYSALIMKIPERELSFVILANTNRLSSASNNIGRDEDVNHSVVAQEFLNAFVYGTAQLPDSLIY